MSAISQFEVKDIEVLLHAFYVGGLGNDHYTILDQKAQCGLGYRFAVFCANLPEHRIGEHTISALGKGSPGLNLGPISTQYLLGGLLLLEHVGFHLIHRGNDLAKVCQVNKAIRIEIAHSDSSGFTGPIGCLHGSISAIVVTEGLVDEQQVHIVGLQGLQRGVDGSCGFFLSGRW